MLGLGETLDEVREVMRDMRAHDVDMVTLGQYLQPSRDHLALERMYTLTNLLSWPGTRRRWDFPMLPAAPLCARLTTLIFRLKVNLASACQVFQ